MSDPNSMPAPAPVMEEKKRSEEFSEYYKSTFTDEKLAESRSSRDLLTYNQYADTTDLLYNIRPGFVRPMVQVNSVRIKKKETKFDNDIPTPEMSFKDRQKKKIVDFRARKSWTDMNKLEHDQLLSAKKIYDPTEESASRQDTIKKPSDEDIQEVLTKNYNPEFMFGPVAIADKIQSTSLVMEKMRSVMEYIRPGTPYYEEASAVVKARIQYLNNVFRKMNDCYQKSLMSHDLKMENGKLVELPELGRHDVSRQEQCIQAVQGLTDYARQAEIIEEQFYWKVMEENIKKRKESMRSELEKGAKGAQVFKTPFGMVAGEKEQNNIGAFLVMLDSEAFKDKITKCPDMIKDMLARYINNNKTLFELMLEQNAIDEEAAFEASKIDGPNVSMEEIKKGLHYGSVLKQKKAMLQNVKLAYEHANSLLYEILDRSITMGDRLISDDAKKYLAEAGYTQERDIVQQKVTQARVYSDTVNGTVQAFDEALMRRFPPGMEPLRVFAKTTYLKTAPMGLMKPGDPVYNDHVLDIVMKRADANMYAQEIKKAEKDGKEPNPQYVAQQKQLILETSYATETIVGAEVKKLLDLGMDFFVYNESTITEKLAELTPLYLQLNSMRMMFNWNTDIDGYTILDRALNKPVPYLKGLDEAEYQRQMDAYMERYTEFSDRMDMLEGLTYIARGRALSTYVTEYGHYSEWVSLSEYQMFKQEGDSDSQVMAKIGLELGLKGSEKYLKASDRVLRRMKKKEEPSGSKAD